MQRDTFSRARKILGIRILPRAPTLQTYLFWPIGVNQRRELAQYSSDSRFFWSSCNATCYIFTCAKKKLDPIWLPLIRLFAAIIVDFSCFLRGSASKGPCLRRHRRVDRRRFDGERGDERRERLLARHRAASCPSDAAPSCSPPRRVLPQRRSAGAPRLSGRPLAPRQPRRRRAGGAW